MIEVSLKSVIARREFLKPKQSRRLFRNKLHLLAMTNDQGFSLLEIIVSLIIFAALAAGIFSTVSFAKRVSLQASQKSIAVSYIESRFNDLKSLADQKTALDPVKSVQNPMAFNDLDALKTADCTKVEDHSKTAPFCLPIKEFGNDRNGYKMTGLVMVKMADSVGTLKEVFVVAKWVDFAVKDRIRTESAVTLINTD